MKNKKIVTSITLVLLIVVLVVAGCALLDINLWSFITNPTVILIFFVSLIMTIIFALIFIFGKHRD